MENQNKTIVDAIEILIETKNTENYDKKQFEAHFKVLHRTSEGNILGITKRGVKVHENTPESLLVDIMNRNIFIIPTEPVKQPTWLRRQYQAIRAFVKYTFYGRHKTIQWHYVIAVSLFFYLPALIFVSSIVYVLIKKIIN